MLTKEKPTGTFKVLLISDITGHSRPFRFGVLRSSEDEIKHDIAKWLRGEDRLIGFRYHGGYGRDDPFRFQRVSLPETLGREVEVSIVEDIPVYGKDAGTYDKVKQFYDTGAVNGLLFFYTFGDYWALASLFEKVHASGLPLSEEHIDYDGREHPLRMLTALYKVYVEYWLPNVSKEKYRDYDQTISGMMRNYFVCANQQGLFGYSLLEMVERRGKVKAYDPIDFDLKQPHSADMVAVVEETLKEH